MQAILVRLAARGWAAVPLRLIVGYGFIAHGLAKLERGPDHFRDILTALGAPAPAILSWATILVELAGGAAVLAGAAVPFAAVPMAIVLIVAIVTVHLPNGFSSIKLQSVDAAGAHFGQPGYETDLLYLAGLAALTLTGPGALSIANLRRARSAPSESGRC
jgi:putative oxidoreductase